MEERAKEKINAFSHEWTKYPMLHFKSYQGSTSKRFFVLYHSIRKDCRDKNDLKRQNPSFHMTTFGFHSGKQGCSSKSSYFSHRHRHCDAWPIPSTPSSHDLLTSRSALNDLIEKIFTPNCSLAYTLHSDTKYFGEHTWDLGEIQEIRTHSTSVGTDNREDNNMKIPREREKEEESIVILLAIIKTPLHNIDKACNKVRSQIKTTCLGVVNTKRARSTDQIGCYYNTGHFITIKSDPYVSDGYFVTFWEIRKQFVRIVR
ncbi:hypothetical protein GQR58_014448 [Nymphon striatum]|nr:hypothetical protein GQR58_014448 [Nymphon striatum]